MPNNEMHVYISDVQIRVVVHVGGLGADISRDGRSAVKVEIPACVLAPTWKKFKLLYNCSNTLHINKLPVPLTGHEECLLYSDKRRQFVIAHELAHLKNGDLDKDDSIAEQMQKKMSSIMSSMSSSYFQKRQRREFAADEIAASLGPEFVEV